MRPYLPALALALTGCTTIDTALIREQRGMGELFVTQQDISEPYQSLGPVQTTVRGIIWFGIDFAGANLNDVLGDVFLPQLRRVGADGAINVRYDQIQYLTLTRVLLFFFPLPSEVTVTGEAVRLRR
jgi:hypothetical protein